MFRITNDPIQVHNLRDTTLDQVGGIVTFEGRVRNDNHGMRVEKLEYEAFPEMAESEGMKIITEAKALFAIEEAYCIHRTGLLTIRDLAIWKEYYVDGHTDWVKCLSCAAKGVAHHDHFHHI